MTGTGMVLAATTKSTGSSATSYLLIIVLIAVMMLFMFRSSRRRQQSAQNTRNALVNGARVRTVHGIYGTVRGIDDQNVMVEVAPGVQIKMLKQAVGTVLPDDASAGVPDTTQDADSSWSTPDLNGQQPDGADTSAKSQQDTDLSR